MSDTTHKVEVQFTAKDLTSSVINRINESAGVLSKSVDNITTKVAGFAKVFGGLSAVFGFGASIASANKYLATIEELSTLTGQSANKMAAITHAMEQSGLAGEEVRMIMLGISKKQADITAGSTEMVKMAKRYGVELTKGPEAALISMSKAVESGKIGTGEVVKLLEESGSKAMDLLRKGPAEVQRLLAEGAKKNSHINDRTVAQYKAMVVQMSKVKQAWTRVTTTIMIKLAPALTKLMAFVERNIDGWVESAGRFGDYMAAHMSAMITAAKVFGKVMLTNYALMKLTGDGLLSNVGKIGKWAKGTKAAAGGTSATDAVVAASMLPGRKGGRVSGRAGVMAKRQGPKVGKTMTKLLGRFPKIGLALLLSFKRIGTVGGKFSKTFGKVGKIVGKVGKVFAKVAVATGPLLKVASVLMKLTVVGVVITAVVAGIQQIMSNVDGIRDRLGSLLGKTWENIKSIGESLSGLVGPGSFLREFFGLVGKGFVFVLEKLLSAFEKVTYALSVAAVMISEKVGPGAAKSILLERKADKILAAGDVTAGQLRGASALSKQLAAISKTTKVSPEQNKMFNEMITLAKKGGLSDERIAGMIKRQGLGRFADTPSGREKRTFDFRGSRFDIMQSFAEGFDPDRIAVAFSNDLAGLGERRLQSGLAPAFSAR